MWKVLFNSENLKRRQVHGNAVQVKAVEACEVPKSRNSLQLVKQQCRQRRSKDGFEELVHVEIQSCKVVEVHSEPKRNGDVGKKLLSVVRENGEVSQYERRVMV